MNLDTVVRIRKWEVGTQSIRIVDVNLGDIVRNPTHFNMADLGLHLVNAIRDDMELPLIDGKRISPDSRCPACTGIGNIHQNCILR